jgi:HK97 family phage major capsid protein
MKKPLTVTGLKTIIASAVKNAVEEQVAVAVAPLKQQQTNYMGPVLAAPAVHTDTAKSNNLVSIVRSLYEGSGDANRTMQLCRNRLGDAVVARSLAAGDLTAGGILVHGDLANEVIDLLRAKSVVRKSNPRVIQVPHGTTTFPALSTSTTAGYVNEGSDITASDAVFEGRTLALRKLAALTSISRDLLKFSNQSADAIIQEDMAKGLATREDQAFLRDTGAENTPKGLRYATATANILTTEGTSATNVEDDFKNAIQALRGANVPMEKPVWFMNPRSLTFLYTLRDGNGNLMYPEARAAQPTVFGYPVFDTTNIPANLSAGGGTGTEIFLVDASEIVVGEVNGIEMMMSAEGAYKNSAGTMVSTISRDEVVIRTILRHDIILRHDVSCSVVTDVIWGA